VILTLALDKVEGGGECEEWASGGRHITEADTIECNNPRLSLALVLAPTPCSGRRRHCPATTPTLRLARRPLSPPARRPPNLMPNFPSSASSRSNPSVIESLARLQKLMREGIVEPRERKNKMGMPATGLMLMRRPLGRVRPASLFSDRHIVPCARVAGKQARQSLRGFRLRSREPGVGRFVSIRFAAARAERGGDIHIGKPSLYCFVGWHGQRERESEHSFLKSRDPGARDETRSRAHRRWARARREPASHGTTAAALDEARAELTRGGEMGL